MGLSQQTDRIFCMQDVEHQHKAHRSIGSPEPIDYKVSELGDDVSTPRSQNPRCSSCHHSGVDIHGVRARRGPRCCIFRESSVTASQLNDIPGQTLAVERIENAGRIEERLPLFLGRHSTVANLSHPCLHARPCRISWPRRCNNVRPTLQPLHDRAIRSTGSVVGGRQILKCLARLRQLPHVLLDQRQTYHRQQFESLGQRLFSPASTNAARHQVTHRLPPRLIVTLSRRRACLRTQVHGVGYTLCKRLPSNYGQAASRR